jgi:sugar phosphate isomerase/epimerase
MKLRGGAAHLTYCTNIHPGETWAEVRANLERQVVAVKQQVAPSGPFGVGLRLSGAAAAELRAPAALADLQALLARHDLYVFTVNAFPHGTFHGTAVKEAVYRPDWLEPERQRYTEDVAEVMARLLAAAPANTDGSISTVPGCFRARAAEPGASEAVARAVAGQAAALWQRREAGGPLLALALEPEPECLLETTTDGLRFLKQHVFSGEGLARFAADTGLGAAEAEAALHRHVGLCLDACHAAVEFEDAGAALAALASDGVAIYKLQVSAGLRIPRPDRDQLAALQRFAEGVYLHQVVIRRGTALERVLDLPEALAATDPDDPGDEWRIHFHVPLFRQALGPFESTQPFLADLLDRQRRAPFTRHLEVETYTWDVLPEEHRGEPVADAVARELRWVLERLGEA